MPPRTALPLLVCLGIAVQAWSIGRATVPAQDAVRLVRLAQGIESGGVAAVLRDPAEQPLFPLLVWAVHKLLAFLGQPPSDWALAAQWAAALPLIVAVVPVYWLLNELAGRRAALCGTVLFVCLSELARLGADGLSESTQLLLLAAALWCLARYCKADKPQPSPASAGPQRAGRRPSISPAAKALAWLGAAGLLTGLAALAKSEAFALAALLPLALLLQAAGERRRRPFGRWAAACACWCLAAGAPIAAIIIAAGDRSVGAILCRVTGRPLDDALLEPAALAEEPGRAELRTRIRSFNWRLEDGQRMSFPKKDPATSLRTASGPAALGECLKELAEAFDYWLLAPALLGLWRQRRAGWRRIDQLLAVFCIGYATLVGLAAWHRGYAAARHFLPLVVPALAPAAAGWIASSRQLRNRARTWGREGSRSPLVVLPTGKPRAWNKNHPTEGLSTPALDLKPGAQSRQRRACRLKPRGARRWLRNGACLLLIALAAWLPHGPKPLHAGRWPHRRAGDWLAAHAAAPCAVLDTRGWTAFYSGCRTYGIDQARAAFSDPHLAYVVLERHELHYASRRSLSLQAMVAGAAERVAVFEESQAPGKSVEIYRWHPDRFAMQFGTTRLAN